ncbi:MAG: endonuclease [Thermoleophilaceae bacterium]|nr:endonuclease [Thermoleophilaceae bacterium]
MASHDEFKRPTRRRVRAIRDRLRETYGEAVLVPHRDPVHELVLTILSQHTNDRNRDVAYGRLRESFPDWDAVAAAPEQEVADAIRPGGLANIKAARIQAVLRELAGDDLHWIEHAPLQEARDYLCSLPGVGRKTTACVLLFSYGRPDIPVDTHVDRVGKRLGLFRPKASFEEEHDEMLRVADPEDAYDLHMNLIRHGRLVCKARAPRCHECTLLRMCPYGRAQRSSG